MVASNPYEINVGWRLTRARRAAGLSQQEIAEELGVSAAVVRRYERGTGRPSPRHLLVMADMMGLTLETLFTRWHSERRRLESLEASRQAKFRPLLRLWQACRGQWRGDIADVLEQSELKRTLLVRRPPRGDRLIFEQFGAGMRTRKPTDTYFVEMLGHDMYDLPDQEYGAWMAEIYDHALARRQPRLDYTEAVVSPSPTLVYRIRHDRLILPWSVGGDLFAMGVSMPKELAVAS